MWAAAVSGAVGICLPNSLVKDTLEVTLRQGGTLNVLVNDLVRLVDLLDVVEHVLVLDRLHVLLGQGGSGGRVVAKIDLGTDEDDGSSRRVVGDLWEPLGIVRCTALVAQRGNRTGRECISYLCGNVIVRRRAHDGETDEEHIGLGIGQGPESIIILLACSVPKTQTDRLAIDNDASRVVVKPVMGEPKVNNKRSRAQVNSVTSEGGTNTVGMYSPGKALVVYEMRRQVYAKAIR